MNIKILDSWLREFITTKATPRQIAEALSLTSVSVDRIESWRKDTIYEIEIPSNRADLMSVIGLAQETAVALPQFDIKAQFAPPSFAEMKEIPRHNRHALTIKIDEHLVNRVCAVVLEVTLTQSPHFIKERLEASGIRSLNNVVDITNVVMREIGHPTHVLDYDRLATKRILIREARGGEKVVTLDHKEYTLSGGDIVAEDGDGRIIDLLGIMGLENSVVKTHTKRVVYFINNDEPSRIRKTSLSLGIRTEAAILNEKHIDPERAYHALIRGIELFRKWANGEVASEIIDMYPNKRTPKTILLSQEKVEKIIGTPIPETFSVHTLSQLGFKVQKKNGVLSVSVPSWRAEDIQLEEDLVEEIARIYRYQKLPSVLPPHTFPEAHIPLVKNDEFYWEERVKQMLKYWGFTEVYTYSMVSEELLESPVEEAVTIANPLTEDMVYMRKTLVPSLLQVIKENNMKDVISLFEISHVYHRREGNLPKETLMLAGVVKNANASFFHVKGIIQQLLSDLGIQNVSYKKRRHGGEGADVYIENEYLGDIEMLEEDVIDFELNFESIIQNAALQKVYKPIPKFPPVIEDVRIVADPKISYEEVISLVKKQSNLVNDVSLLDAYQDKKTFRITYLDREKNLTNKEVAKIREKIYTALEKELKARIV